MLDAFNATALDHDRDATVDALFHAQVAATPDAPALSSGATTFTYGELQAAVAALARPAGRPRGHPPGPCRHRRAPGHRHARRRARHARARGGVRPARPHVPDRAAAVHGRRLRARRAPRRRVDGRRAGPTGDPRAGPGARCRVGPSASRGPLVGARPERPRLRHLHVRLDRHAEGRAWSSTATSSTSSSAMDEVIDREPAGVWLAVTSLSFDISVLELLWTLTRGFRVVLKSDRGPHRRRRHRRRRADRRRRRRPVSLSLFYFASDEDERRRRLPPAPRGRAVRRRATASRRCGRPSGTSTRSVASTRTRAWPGAALAAITEQRRHPRRQRGAAACTPRSASPRSGRSSTTSRDGRVAHLVRLRLAAQRLRAQPDRASPTPRRTLPTHIELVRRLWRGETVPMPGPRRRAGRRAHAAAPGAGRAADLAHLGRHAGDVRARPARSAPTSSPTCSASPSSSWPRTSSATARRGERPGTPGEGRVTLMLHTFVARRRRGRARSSREPMKSYLRHRRRAARATSPRRSRRSPADGKGTDDLFKTPHGRRARRAARVRLPALLRARAACSARRRRRRGRSTPCQRAGVDEIACLIDFGVATDDVLASLDRCSRRSWTSSAQRRAAERSRPPARGTPSVDDESSPASSPATVSRTCSARRRWPRMLARRSRRSGRARPRRATSCSAARRSRRRWPRSCARSLPERFTNMYGPTETTIWSLPRARRRRRRRDGADRRADRQHAGLRPRPSRPAASRSAWPASSTSAATASRAATTTDRS